MNISTLMCSYIYEAFVTIEAALETAVNIAIKLLDVVTGTVKVVIYQINTVLADIISLVRGSLSDFLQNMSGIAIDYSSSEFCKNMFKCGFIQRYLADEDSVLWGTVSKLFPSTEEASTQIANSLKSFYNFRDTICSNIEIGFSVDALADFLSEEIGILKSWIIWLNKKRRSIVKQLDNYIEQLQSLGILDYLRRLREMFDCILDDTDLCRSAESANSLYRSVMAKLKLTIDEGGKFAVDPEFKSRVTGFISSNVSVLNGLISEMETALKNATGNTSSTVLCIDLLDTVRSISTAVKTGNLSALPIYKYAKCTWEKFLAQFQSIIGSSSSKSWTLEDVMEHTEFREDGIYFDGQNLALESSEDSERYIILDHTISSSEKSRMTHPVLINNVLYSGSYALAQYAEGDSEFSEFFDARRRFVTTNNLEPAIRWI